MLKRIFYNWHISLIEVTHLPNFIVVTFNSTNKLYRIFMHMSSFMFTVFVWVYCIPKIWKPSKLRGGGGCVCPIIYNDFMYLSDNTSITQKYLISCDLIDHQTFVMTGILNHAVAGDWIYLLPTNRIFWKIHDFSFL